MRTRFALAALAAATLSTIAAAQMGQGMGPGMMGGYGMGPGTGPQDCPMVGQGAGPGMGGMGMMHGRGGMHGGHGMKGGQGLMAGPGLRDIEALDLTAEQRGKVTEIRRDLQRRNHALMGSLREIRWKGQDLAKAPQLDEAAARKLYDEGAAVRKQMFEARLEARSKAEALLTKEQLEQLRSAPRPGPGPMRHRMS